MNTQPDNLIKRWVNNSLVCIFVLSITACGGGGEEGSSSNQPNNNDQSNETTSTELGGNTAPIDYDFEQFVTHRLQLDIPKLANDLYGNYYLIKLYDSASNTYLLVTQTTPQVINATLSVPASTNRLTLEIYTDLPEYGKVTKEIVL